MIQPWSLTNYAFEPMDVCLTVVLTFCTKFLVISWLLRVETIKLDKPMKSNKAQIKNPEKE